MRKSLRLLSDFLEVFARLALTLYFTSVLAGEALRVQASDPPRAVVALAMVLALGRHPICRDVAGRPAQE